MAPLTTVATPDGIGVVVPWDDRPSGLGKVYQGWHMVMLADGFRAIYDETELAVLYTPEVVKA